MKFKIYNTVVGLVGSAAMVKYVLTAGMAATWGGLGTIMGLTVGASIVGTLILGAISDAIQAKKERQYTEMLMKAYGKR